MRVCSSWPEGRGGRGSLGGQLGRDDGRCTLVLGRIAGVERPAIVTTFPTQTGQCALLDMGANVDVRPTVLAPSPSSCRRHIAPRTESSPDAGQYRRPHVYVPPPCRATRIGRSGWGTWSRWPAVHPAIRPNTKSAPAIIAPELPAETTASTSPLWASSKHTRIDDAFFCRRHWRAPRPCPHLGSVANLDASRASVRAHLVEHTPDASLVADQHDVDFRTGQGRQGALNLDARSALSPHRVHGHANPSRIGHGTEFRLKQSTRLGLGLLVLRLRDDHAVFVVAARRTKPGEGAAPRHNADKERSGESAASSPVPGGLPNGIWIVVSWELPWSHLLSKIVTTSLLPARKLATAHRVGAVAAVSGSDWRRK